MYVALIWSNSPCWEPYLILHRMVFCRNAVMFNSRHQLLELGSSVLDNSFTSVLTKEVNKVFSSKQSF